MWTTATIVLCLAGQPALRVPAAPDRDGLQARVDAVVAEAMSAPEAVGLSVAVALGDEIVVAQGYGLAEVEHQVPAGADTTFRIGSVTKQFTAAAVMRLYERGELELDEDMCVYLPDYPAGEQVVTLRHLLTHTSGIPSYTDLGEVFWDNAIRDLTHPEMLAMFQDLPLEFRPGQRWAYNNSGYYLLGMIIEQVSEQGYAEYMQEQFFTPLGLTRMRYGSNSDVIPNRAQGYRMQDGELENDAMMSMSAPGAAGALLASAEDLVRWQLALVSGKVVSAESYAEMTTPFMLDDLTETTYGMGLQLGDLDGRTAVQHGGGIFGFNSHLAYLPEECISVAVISNCEAFSSDEVSRQILRVVLED